MNNHLDLLIFKKLSDKISQSFNGVDEHNLNIFVCHSSEDKKILSKLKDEMIKYHVNLFLAHADITPGNNDFTVIKENIKNCHVFLLIGNESSKASEFCDQEIGMAIAYEKFIIPVMMGDKSDSGSRINNPWGFIRNNQAIKCFDLLKDLPLPLCECILKRWDEAGLNNEIKYLTKLGVTGFTTDKTSNSNLIQLRYINWDDHEFKTKFSIIKHGTSIGVAKIGFFGQVKGQKTIDHIPKNFQFLPGKFFSVISTCENVTDDEKGALRILLNEVVYNKEFLKYFHESVLKTSLLRHHEICKFYD